MSMQAHLSQFFGHPIRSEGADPPLLRDISDIYIVGLTGGIGSGKSTVGNLFAERGILVIDADEISHAITAPQGQAIPAIVRGFGKQALDDKGAMNRRYIREQVFTDPDKRHHLEAILHPLIRKIIREQTQQAVSPYVIWMIPLLIEGAKKNPHWREHLFRVLVVQCEASIRQARVMARSQLSIDMVKQIMATQSSDAMRMRYADDTIYNESEPHALDSRVEALHQFYLAHSRMPLYSPQSHRALRDTKHAGLRIPT